ncbi:MAG: L-2-amino-thiazoline-4-carboxylic acid hydrolase [Candidatus Thorarchaeota archaeon]|jgi:hypothetical protein
MKFVKTGKYREDTLDRIIEIDTLKDAKWRLERMNYLFGVVRKQKQEAYPEYVNNLLVKYQNLLDEERREASPFDMDEILSEIPNMTEHSELVRTVLNYFIQVLQLPVDAKPGKHEVVNRNYFKSFSHISYPSLLVLTETIGRAEAITLYKKFITHYYLDKRDPDRKTYDNLETLYERRIQPQDTPSDWEIVHGMFGDGKYAFRNDNCVFMSAIGNDLPDTELKYYIACYGDYEKFKDYDDSVILTMEHTIAQGDPYCSRMLHDTRVDWDLKHPPKDFWDSMKPDNE